MNPMGYEEEIECEQDDKGLPICFFGILTFEGAQSEENDRQNEPRNIVFDGDRLGNLRELAIRIPTPVSLVKSPHIPGDRLKINICKHGHDPGKDASSPVITPSKDLIRHIISIQTKDGPGKRNDDGDTILPEGKEEETTKTVCIFKKAKRPTRICPDVFYHPGADEDDDK